MMEFNYLTEKGVIMRVNGRYAIDSAKAVPAIAALAKELLEMEGTGDRARVEAWFEKYGKMPADLKTALASATDIPVDVRPVFSFPDRVQ
jgi:hypothetical protein